MLRTKALSLSKVKRLHERASERLRAPDAKRFLWVLEPSKGLSAPLFGRAQGSLRLDSVALWMAEGMPASASWDAV